MIYGHGGIGERGHQTKRRQEFDGLASISLFCLCSSHAERHVPRGCKCGGYVPPPSFCASGSPESAVLSERRKHGALIMEGITPPTKTKPLQATVPSGKHWRSRRQNTEIRISGQVPFLYQVEFRGLTMFLPSECRWSGVHSGMTHRPNQQRQKAILPFHFDMTH